MILTRRARPFFLAALPLTAFLSYSSAQDVEAETVVTARKWEEDVSEVPASVTVVSGEDLEQAGIQNTRNLIERVPNATVAEFSTRRTQFPFVRGIGSGQGDPAVVVYIDNVPQLSVATTNLPFLHLDRVEFLRGPQGTLYGRNAIGGVLHMISKSPTEEAEYGAGVTVGNFGLQEYGLSYFGPVGSDGTLLSVSGMFSAREGYTDNDFTGNDVDDKSAFFGRASLHLFPDEDSELRIGLHGQRARDGSFALTELNGLKANPFRINQNFEGVAERNILAPSVTYRQFGESVDLISITAFSDSDVFETSDFDFSPFDAVMRRTEEEEEFFYQEVRLSSAETQEIELGDEAELRWLVGISGFSADADRSARNTFGADSGTPGLVTSTDGDFEDEGVALFGQATVTVADDVDLTAGLRYDYESREADTNDNITGAGAVTDSQDESFDSVVPHFSAAYRATDDTLVYGLASKAFKAGGFNNNNFAGVTDFGQEKVWTYEVGVKQSFADDRVGVRAAAFYVDWQDLQVTQFDGVAGAFVDNVGDASSEGVELEIEAGVADGVDAYGTLGLLNTDVDDYTTVAGDTGDELTFAPEETWALGLQAHGELREDADWFAQAEYTGVGTFAYDAAGRETESFQLVNVRGGVAWKDYSVHLWVRNLFDEEYIPIAFQPDPTTPALFVGENGAPRTYGITLRASF